MPTPRASRPCHCPRHNGQCLTYHTHLACQTRRLLHDCVPNYERSKEAPDDITTSVVQGNINMDILSDEDDHCEIGSGDEADTLSNQLFANMIDHNMTQNAVTAICQSWLCTMGTFIPPEIRANIPQTHRQLVAKFKPKMLRLIRIPVCPGECRLLDDVKPTLAYVCHCSGTGKRAWRYV